MNPQFLTLVNCLLRIVIKLLEYFKNIQSLPFFLSPYLTQCSYLFWYRIFVELAEAVLYLDLKKWSLQFFTHVVPNDSTMLRTGNTAVDVSIVFIEAN